MPKLLIVTRAIPLHPESGGMEHVGWDLARALATHFEVSILTTQIPGRPTSFTVDGLRVMSVPGTRPGRYGWRWWFATARHRPLPPRILSVSAGATVMAWLHRGPNYVFQVHGTALANARANVRSHGRLWQLKAIRSLCWALVDAATYRRAGVVAVSERVAAQLQRAPYRLKSVTVVANGVDSDHLRRGVRGPANDPRIVAVTASRLHRQKGVDRLIAALPRAEGVLALIVGDGDQRAALEEQAERIGVADRVRFTGKVERTDVAAMLAAGDVFVFPVRTPEIEGLPVSVLEALACGLPVLVSAESQWPEDLVPLMTFVDAGDPDSLAHGLLSAGKTLDRSSRLPSRYGIDRAAAEYSRILLRRGRTPEHNSD